MIDLTLASPLAPLVGTAGWSIPRAAAEAFPGPGSHLERYAALMPAVEINSSFHRPRRRTTYERWAASTPAGFRFSVKLPKAITHVRKLSDADVLLDDFVAQVEGLGEKLGVVLVQLPPSLQFDDAVAREFFAALCRRLAPSTGIAAEPRQLSWSGDAATACLIDCRVARVAADPAAAEGFDQPAGWHGLHYRRLHGSPRVYYTSYDDQRLVDLAVQLAKGQEAAIPSWCVFDNTASGAALTDATRLRSLMTQTVVM